MVNRTVLPYSIYILTSTKLDEPFYVGCTKLYPSSRLSQHKRAKIKGESHTPLARIKVSPETASITVIEATYDRDEAHRREQHWISHYGREPDGPLVNKLAGGMGSIDPLPDTRKKMGKAHIGNTYRKGIPRPDARIRNSKTVSAFDKTGAFFKTYPSARAASEDLVGISPKSISSVIHGRLACARTEVGQIYQFRLGDDQLPMGAVEYRDTWRKRRSV